MRNNKIGFVCLTATFLVILMAGCGQETVTIPSVTSVTPAQGSANVAVNTAITATFSLAMNPASLNASTFTVVAPNGVVVAGAVAYSGVTATFAPSGALANSTTYTATITTGASTPGGTALMGNYTWTFSTVAATPPMPLSVTVTPAPFTQNLPLSATISASFSQTMNCATLASPATSFTVTDPGGVAVAGVVTCSGSLATFIPTGGALGAYGTTYTATITTSATDEAGTSLTNGNYVWTFTTIALPPVTNPAPMVALTNPVTPNATGVPPVLEDLTVPTNLASVSANFNEPMDAELITNAANFTLIAQGSLTPIAGTISYVASTNSMVFHLSAPSPALTINTTYTATITGGDLGVRSAAGQPMAGNYVWNFKTSASTDATPPELVRTAPGDTSVGVQATQVPLNQAISATFSKAMDQTTVLTAFQLYEGTTASGTPLAAKITYNDTTQIATLTPAVLLTANTTYTATVTNAATDTAGNPLGSLVPSPFTNPWSFKTGGNVVVPPVVLGPFIAPVGTFGGGAGITNQGLLTVINGNIETTGASTLITGFHDTTLPKVGATWPCTYTETPLNSGQVNGVIDTAPGTSEPTSACPDEGTSTTFDIATEAAGEARIAYTTLQGLPSTGVLAAELGGTTIYPGVYANASSVAITLGDLTLDAQGDPNAYWVFQIGSSLTVGDPVGPQTRSVILSGGAKAANVFWAVGGLPGAIINYGGGGTMVGTILSQPGITVSSPAQSTSATISIINGRVIALDASTTLVNTVINVPAQ